MKCTICKDEIELVLSLDDYVRTQDKLLCITCEGPLVRNFRTATPVSIPYHMQSAPSATKKEKARVPINIIDEKPDGGYKVTRIGKKSDLDNE